MKQSAGTNRIFEVQGLRCRKPLTCLRVGAFWKRSRFGCYPPDQRFDRGRFASTFRQRSGRGRSGSALSYLLITLLAGGRAQRPIPLWVHHARNLNHFSNQSRFPCRNFLLSHKAEILVSWDRQWKSNRDSNHRTSLTRVSGGGFAARLVAESPSANSLSNFSELFA
jgi:hypothetical protein